jgi:hypothetical protein
MSNETMKSTEEIVYDETVRAIEQQPHLLNELRSRAAVVLAASGVIGGVVGKAANDSGGIGAAGGIAVVLLVAVACLCVWVLLPKWDQWKFVSSAAILLADHVDVPTRNDPQKLYRFLAEELERGYDHNERKLKSLYQRFWWACVLLTVDVGMWLLELIT